MSNEGARVRAKNSLTSKKYWDTTWKNTRLPIEIKKSNNLYINSILNVFDTYLPVDKDLTILEIGGAPGGFLVYMAKNYGYQISALDYSMIGCTLLKENFKLLNLNGHIFQKDLFHDDLSKIPKFNIVYSLGFIEHFLNLENVIKKHLELLKEGGILLIGTPNFLGINYYFLKIMSPIKLSRHYLSSMDIENWESFEKKYNLKIIFKEYIGGYEPRIYSFENRNIFTLLLYGIFKVVKVFTDKIKFLRRINSKKWSSYVIGIYRYDKQ